MQKDVVVTHHEIPAASHGMGS